MCVKTLNDIHFKTDEIKLREQLQPSPYQDTHAPYIVSDMVTNQRL